MKIDLISNKLKLDEVVKTNIRKELKKRGLSQNKLAEMSGIKPSNFSRSMKKNHGISKEFFLAVSNALGYDTEKPLLQISEGMPVDDATRSAWNLLLDAKQYNYEYFSAIINLLSDIKDAHEKHPEIVKAICNEIQSKSSTIKELLKAS